jgi:hypothetical protein
MAQKNKEVATMHWRDRWEYEARREAQSLKRLSERELLERIQSGNLGRYYSIWRAIGSKGTVWDAAMVLWRFLEANPGENMMHDRYHCAAALFKVLGTPDPAVQNELRRRVQWDNQGEEARQRALAELKEIIQQKLDGPEARER